MKKIDIDYVACVSIILKETYFIEGTQSGLAWMNSNIIWEEPYVSLCSFKVSKDFILGRPPGARSSRTARLREKVFKLQYHVYLKPHSKAPYSTLEPRYGGKVLIEIREPGYETGLRVERICIFRQCFGQCNSLLFHSFVNFTFFEHSELNTFLKTTVLTSNSVAFIDYTFTLLDTNVLKLFLNRSFKEALASFATFHSVMKARCFVTANCAYACTFHRHYRLHDKTFFAVYVCKQKIK